MTDQNINNNNLQPVIDNNMCIACGACIMADQSLSIQFNSKTMMYEPSGSGNEMAAKVCPSIKVDYDFLHQKRFPNITPNEHGVVDSIWLAQSTNITQNRNASSGGVIKELLLNYLSLDEVDGVIAINHKKGLEFEPDIIRNADEVQKLPGSIYHALSSEKVLKLLKENDGRYVIIAIPCQLEGIYSYIYNNEPDLVERIHTVIGLSCGWYYNHHALKAICEYKNIDYEKISDISYRGGGPIGKLKITSNGKETAISRRIDFDYQVAFDRSFNIPRCHFCINHVNYFADIVVADAWLPCTVGTKTGTSLVICRKSSTTETMKKLVDSGKIRVADATVDDIVDSQMRRNAFGDFAYAYAKYVKDNGGFCPDLKGPNFKEAYLISQKMVKSFHSSLILKRQLQQTGKYKKLWWRKATIELPKLSWRYIRWFLVKFLKIKALSGRKHKEIPRKLNGFL